MACRDCAEPHAVKLLNQRDQEQGGSIVLHGLGMAQQVRQDMVGIYDEHKGHGQQQIRPGNQMNDENSGRAYKCKLFPSNLILPSTSFLTKSHHATMRATLAAISLLAALTMAFPGIKSRQNDLQSCVEGVGGKEGQSYGQNTGTDNSCERGCILTESAEGRDNTGEACTGYCFPEDQSPAPRLVCRGSSSPDEP
ncbi:uncharacterized protein RCC_10066 [Ramularia collo-cygni]|uniref:Uncharacterized protein n=1 Tax=Ramularia collo-cygni TaxID=112498 RepID=A0A2D3V8L3_9PEZI|nr:uncharacterized protein RCC_10066 [Ramularia collo-cygni]CZT24343.1 uncharacterized protein RCC_10066 [Ramularia collo-cygni]